MTSLQVWLMALVLVASSFVVGPRVDKRFGHKTFMMAYCVCAGIICVVLRRWDVCPWFLVSFCFLYESRAQMMEIDRLHDFITSLATRRRAGSEVTLPSPKPEVLS